MRADQPPLRYVPVAEIGLLMRTGPLAGDRAPFVPNQNQIDAAHPCADNMLIHQAIEVTGFRPFSSV